MESSDSGEEMVPFPSSGTDISRYALSLAAYMSSSFLLSNAFLSFRCGSDLEVIDRFAALDLYVVVDCLNVSFVIARKRRWPRFAQLSLKDIGCRSGQSTLIFALGTQALLLQWLPAL